MKKEVVVRLKEQSVLREGRGSLGGYRNCVTKILKGTPRVVSPGRSNILDPAPMTSLGTAMNFLITTLR